MRSKIFCDIADINQIKKFNKKKLLKGFTTNPSYEIKLVQKIMKNIQKKYLKFVKNLFHLKFLVMIIIL